MLLLSLNVNKYQIDFSDRKLFIDIIPTIDFVFKTILAIRSQRFVIMNKRVGIKQICIMRS
jgi:hypothetical protein